MNNMNKIDHKNAPVFRQFFSGKSDLLKTGLCALILKVCATGLPYNRFLAFCGASVLFNSRARLWLCPFSSANLRNSTRSNRRSSNTSVSPFGSPTSTRPPSSLLLSSLIKPINYVRRHEISSPAVLGLEQAPHHGGE